MLSVISDYFHDYVTNSTIACHINTVFCKQVNVNWNIHTMTRRLINEHCI